MCWVILYRTSPFSWGWAAAALGGGIIFNVSARLQPECFPSIFCLQFIGIPNIGISILEIRILTLGFDGYRYLVFFPLYYGILHLGLGQNNRP